MRRDEDSGVSPGARLQQLLDGGEMIIAPGIFDGLSAHLVRRMVAGVLGEIPLIADGDTGYGPAPSVARTVRAYERAGAAAIQLEDQAFPKRCGHLPGKELSDGWPT